MEFRTVRQAETALEKAMAFYNNERPHLSLDMRTPAEAVRETGRFKRLWTSYLERAIDASGTCTGKESDRAVATGYFFL